MADTIEIMSDEDICVQLLENTIAELVDSNTVTKIKNSSFYENTNLVKLDLKALEKINNMALQDCTALSEVNFPAVKEVGSYGLAGLDSLKEISLPSITSLSNSALRHCDNLKKIDLGEGLSNISDKSTFEYNVSLDTFILRRTTEPVRLTDYAYSSGEGCFNNTPIASGTGYIYVPDELVEDYKAATNWSNYGDQIKPISELEE